MEKIFAVVNTCLFCLLFMAATDHTLISQTNKDLEFGFNLVSWDQTGTVDANTWKEAVREMHHAGVRSFTIVTYRFVDRKTGGISSTSKYGLAAPPEDRDIAAAIEEGKKLGMQVSLNPFIEVDNPKSIGHEWRGALDFSGEELKSFFANYQAYITGMAQMAEATGVDRLYVGSELKVLSRKSTAQTFWLELIAEARRSFRNKGTLAYAANHDEYKAVPFWNQLDEIGVDAYFSLASQAEAKGVGNPSVSVIKAHWIELLEHLRGFSEQQKRPVILSEWGAAPFDLTTYQPWNWTSSITNDPWEQLNAYKATIEAIASQGDWLRGIQFWHWGMVGSFSSNYSITSDSNVDKLITRYLAGGGL